MREGGRPEGRGMGGPPTPLQVGFYAFTPYLAQFLTGLASGYAADKLIGAAVNRTKVRKGFQCIALLGPATFLSVLLYSEVCAGAASGRALFCGGGRVPLRVWDTAGDGVGHRKLAEFGRPHRRAGVPVVDEGDGGGGGGQRCDRDVGMQPHRRRRLSRRLHPPAPGLHTAHPTTTATTTTIVPGTTDRCTGGAQGRGMCQNG